MNDKQQGTLCEAKEILMDQMRLLHEASKKVSEHLNTFEGPRDLAMLSEAMEKIARLVMLRAKD